MTRGGNWVETALLTRKKKSAYCFWFFFFSFFILNQPPWKSGSNPTREYIVFDQRKPSKKLAEGRRELPEVAARHPSLSARRLWKHRPRASPVTAPAALPAPARGFHAFIKPQKQLFNCFAPMLARCTVPGASAGIYVFFFFFFFLFESLFVSGLCWVWRLKGLFPPPPQVK